MSIPTHTHSSQRIITIDAFRSFALLGLLLVHCSEYFDLYWMDPQPSKIQEAVFFLFAGKSYAIFALLFGLSFYLILEGEKKKGIGGNWRFVWRLVVLFGIGFLHCLIYAGDILQILAVLGLFLVVGNRLKTTWVFVMGIAFLLNGYLIYHFYAAIHNFPQANDMPLHWSLSSPSFKVWTSGTFLECVQNNAWAGAVSKWYFYIETGRIVQIVGLFMMGLWIGRIGLMENIPNYIQKVRKVALGAIFFAAICFSLQQYLKTLPADFIQKEGMANYYLGQWLDSYFALSMVVMWGVLFIFASQHAIGLQILKFLAPAGRMTLTLYVMQSLISIPLYYGFGLGWYKTCDQTSSLIFGLIFFAVQLAIARLWMKRFAFGPLEWAWRKAIYLGK